MNRYVLAFIVSTSLLITGPAWADGPQGKGAKQGKGIAKQEKHQGKHKAKAKAKRDRNDRNDDHERATRQGAMRFQGLDLNGDRVITRAEWRGNDVSFRANDWNRDGVLSGDEVRPDARKPEQFFRKDWRGDLREFDRADTNHDGVLSAEEFARWR
jgi:hypothetical protein